MKIEGNDAVSNVAVLKQYEKMSNNNHTNNAHKVRKDWDKEMQQKNISDITDYDKKEMDISEKVVIEAIEKANKAVLGVNTKFEFSIHDKTKQIMVKVLNTETDAVIREIPAKKILDMLANMWEMAGIIVDEKR